MKLSIILAVLIATTAQSADVVVNLADFTTTGITNRLVHVTPRNTPRATGGFILTGDRRYYYTDTNGLMTASNVVAGAYSVELMGPFAKTTFCISVPETNGVINATLQRGRAQLSAEGQCRNSHNECFSRNRSSVVGQNRPGLGCSIRAVH